MPNGKHVVAVLDKTSRFQAAKVVANTSAPAVTKALSGIYADYGQPETHQTNNDPPFNSNVFEQFSKNNYPHQNLPVPSTGKSGRKVHTSPREKHEGCSFQQAG